MNAAPFLSSDLQRMDQSISSIILKRYSCNDLGYTIFDFSRFTLIESIEIGDGSFKSVKTFQIDGLNRLKTIKIGYNSFTQRSGDNKSKSFHILNCESLESIQIGEYSFSDFGGDFELKNLPQLKKIKFGKMGEKSCNFIYCSFVAKGMSIMICTS